MTSAPELHAFLADLTVRRTRLLELGESDPHADDLRDLAERMQLADEELRVQQEELDDVSRRLTASIAENESYFQASPHARVITDLDGGVRRTNTAADQLIRRRADRPTRPIALWFEVADRGRVRNLIGRMQRCVRARQDGSAADQGMLRLPGGEPRPVVIAVTTATDVRTGAPVLRWELRPDLKTPDRPLRVVTDAPPADEPDRASFPVDRPGQLSIALAESLTSMAGQLAGCTDLDGVLKGILEGAISIVPGAQRAAITLCRRDGTEVAAGSDDAALACERAQLAGEHGRAEGPAANAVRNHATVVATIPEKTSQWPRLVTAAARADIRRVLAVPLSYGEQPLGVLSLYSAHPDAFGPAVRSVAPLVAVQGAVALHRMQREEHLQVAMRTRQHIGEAVGVLVERHRILPDEAFRRLVTASQHRNVKVRLIAEAVVQTGQDPEDIQLL
ncbi:GAF and ANTAR domain-containing protein [Kineosporia sp. J2-2]|uniref:GAF and ANTAR domain-containing protein n=1 Tax=Kineosporia corallincola TaxID=2835133 RepID=A0ABS5TEV6_9ACTN|nr:GAF and ANTAR domain-containing protein [Kineosporia corallincola]MBT0769617.1 GAF and ANTAR domain-containing protein [Kineosporia corallincola]